MDFASSRIQTAFPSSAGEAAAQRQFFLNSFCLFGGGVTPAFGRVGEKARVFAFIHFPCSVTQVIFRSDRVLHRVLPCRAERFMLTVWIDSPDVNAPEESTLRITRSQLDDWCGVLV